MSRLLDAPGRLVATDQTGGDAAKRTAPRWALAGLLLIAAGLALGALVAGDAALAWELDAMTGVQRLSWPGLDALAWAVSRVGDSWPGMAVVSAVTIAICLWRGRGDLALLMLGATAARAAGPPLKWLFASPRPPIEPVAVLDHATGFGYPSGHAFGAALVYGGIAVIAPRLMTRAAWARTVQGAALAMMALIALSRVRLGVHWPTDVVGGLSFGLGIVCLLQAGARVSRRDGQ